MEYGRVSRGHLGPVLALTVALAAGGLLTLPGEQGLAAEAAYVDPVLRDALAAGGPQPAILVLDPARIPSVIGALDRLGLERRAYEALGMAAVLLDASGLDAVARLPGVATVYRNEVMRPLLDRSADYVGAKAVWNTYGVTGEGVTVLLMDSGIDASHPDLPYGTKVIENVVPTRRPSGIVGGSKEGVVSSDPDGHGTHVAGIVAGLGAGVGGHDAGKYRGVAPGARLVGYEAGLPDAKTGEIEFESLTVLEGFNWALTNRAKYDLSIVSNSWGANGEFDPRSPVNIATLNLYKAGLLVLIAAGNEGNEGAHTLNKYSVAPWVLSVTAGDYLNQVPRFASRGTDPLESRAPYDHPDVVAPGIGITSTRSLRSRLPPTSDSALYSTKSGSSMATPHVAGVAALLLETNPRLSPDDLMDLLTASATRMRAPAWEAGAGYVNALKAHQLAAKATGHRDAFLEGHVKYAGPASGDADYAKDAVTVGYLKGHASRLRSPDPSLPAFLRGLVATTQGLVLLAGALVLGALAFGRNVPRPPLANPGRGIAAPAWTMPASSHHDVTGGERPPAAWASRAHVAPMHAHGVARPHGADARERPDPPRIEPPRRG
jgi:serine protease AprX